MQSSTPTPKRERRRPQISCTECRRRKQKCNFRKDGPCTNCLRRYPPVECYVQALDPAPSSKEVPKIRNTEVEGGQHPPLPAFTSSASSLPLPHVSNFRYPPIPLSQILNPVSDAPLHGTTPQVRKQKFNLPPITPSGFVIADDEDEKSTVLLSERKRALNFMDPGNEKALHNRITTGCPSPRAIGGMLEMLNTFNTFPVNTSLRNSELFNFYHQYVAPRLCSIDGGSLHPLFAQVMVPWQIQSPLMPNVSILMAAATQSYLRNPEAEMGSEALIIKQHVLSLVNKFLRQDFHLVSHQAIRIVVHLVIIEWWWGSSEALWSHMAGIKRMVELRGGLEGLQYPLIMHVLIVTDYELACGYERDLVFQPTSTALSAILQIPETYPVRFRCPLMSYPTTFRDDFDTLGLSLRAAEILDDIRFLTTSITSAMLDPKNREPFKKSRIQSTAAWIHKQLLSIPPQPITESSPLTEIINDTILLTAKVYTSAISTLTPFAKSFPSDLQERLYTNIALVPLSSWASIPGIFFWILLVATPASEGDYRGRFLRKQMACTGMSIGLEDFMLGTACMRAFWCVQLWVRGEGGLEDGDGGVDEKGMNDQKGDGLV